MNNICIHPSTATRKFTIFSGGLITHGSGFPNSTILSGQNPGTGHSVQVSGNGFVNAIITHQAISGADGYLYDSVLAARSGVGTISESGYSVLAHIPANTWDDPAALRGPVNIPVNVPYASGIAVNLASGVAGVTVVYTPNG